MGVLLSPCVIQRLVLLMTTHCVSRDARTLCLHTKLTLLVALQRQYHVLAVFRRPSTVESLFLFQFIPPEFCGRKISTGSAFSPHTLVFPSQYRGQEQVSQYNDSLRAGRSRDRIPLEARFSAPVETGPGAHPASCTMGTGSFPGIKSGWGVMLTPHPLLVPRSRKSRAITLPPLCAVRPVQSLRACTGVHLSCTCTREKTQKLLILRQAILRDFCN